jgi:hypothetical protein
LVARAAINPGRLNEISFEEHNARPTIIGTKDRLTKMLVCSPKIKILFYKPYINNKCIYKYILLTVNIFLFQFFFETHF